MTILTRALPLSFAVGSLFLLAPGCSSAPSSGLRSCFDTGSSVVCVQSAALSTASRDVNGDGVPDVFVCADDDNDEHDRDRDRDRDGNPATTSDDDEDHDGVSDHLDCGHRGECHELENPENKADNDADAGAGADAMKAKDMDPKVDGVGGAGGSGGHDGSGGTGGEDHSGPGRDGTGGEDHSGPGRDGTGGEDHSGPGHDGSDEHPRTGCNPPAAT